jgi:DNA-binding MarR family transcriptional regulator
VKGSQPHGGKDKSKDETVAAKQDGTVLPWRKAEAQVALSPEPPSRLTLAEYLAQHEGVTYPSQTAFLKAAKAAGVANVSPATVSRQFKHLEGRGKMKRSKHKRGANHVTYGGHGGLQAAV